MNKKIQRLISILNQGGFLKSSLTLMSGSIIAQILAICISPIMTRLYSENEIGGYTLILTAVSMFGSVICGRYDLIIVSERKEERISALIKLCLILTIIVSFFVALGYSIYYFINYGSAINPISAFFWIIILLIFTGIGNILISYNNRYKEYKLMTSVNVIREIGRDIFLILGGILHLGTVGLLFSQTVSVALGLKKQSQNLVKNFGKIVKSSSKEILICLKEYKKQFLYSVPASFANSFSYSVLNLFVGQIFGLESLAYYSMSFRMLGLPLTLFGTNVSKVFFENAAREYEQKRNFRASFVKTSTLLLGVSIPMVVILILFAPWAFGFFFGTNWTISGDYVRILAPMFGIRLVVSALSPTMIVVNKQNIDLILQIIFIICAFGAYLIGNKSGSINLFLYTITISFSVIYIFYYIIMFVISKDKNS